MAARILKLNGAPNDEARKLVATGAPVFVPIDPVEYHGPHLPLDNDALIAEGIATDLHRRLAVRHPDWPFLITEDLRMGCGVTPGPGSRPFAPRAVREAVLGACRAVLALGARRVVLITFHGDPIHNLALHAGVEFLAAKGIPVLAPMPLMVRELMSLEASSLEVVLQTVEDADERRTLAREVRLEFHAGFLETSLTMHYAPRSVSTGWCDVPPCPEIRPDRVVQAASAIAAAAGHDVLATELRFAALGLGWLRLRPFPGYSGRPHLANPEAGRRLATLMIDRLEPIADDVLSGRAPPPPPSFAWLKPASRLGMLWGARD